MNDQYAWLEVGMIVAVECLDWAHDGNQQEADHKFDVIHATVLGRVVRVFDEGIAIAHQLFHREERNVEARQVTAIPWGTITAITKLVEAAPRGDVQP